MKNLISFSLLFIFLAITTIAQAQSSKQLVQLINTPASAQKLLVELPKNRVTLKTLYSNQILIKTTVRLTTEDDELLDYLADKGRYDLLVENSPNTKELLLTTTPQLHGELTQTNGTTIKEHISYTIYLPNKQLQQIHIKAPKAIELSALK